MFGITQLDLVLTYKCNMNCGFCLNNYRRKLIGDDKLLDLKFCEEVFDLLKKEGNQIQSITIYGGELMLLDPVYLREVFDLCLRYFPGSSLGVISNLVYVDEKILSIMAENNVTLSTSYDTMRFQGKSELLKRWVKNMHDFKDMVHSVLILSSRYIFEDVRFVKFLYKDRDIPVLLLLFFIPEGLDFKTCESIRQLILSPSEYVEAVRFIRNNFCGIRTHTFDGGYMFNNVHILPDDTVGIAGPDYEKGYPYEKMYKIYPNEEKTITFSLARLNYIRKQLSICLPCPYYPERCYAEYFFEQVCFGEKILDRFEKSEQGLSC
ncbi:MAG: radical SAM protein [Candidatus Methanomethylicia archaeon]